MAEGEWEQDAENWVLWARKPGFDAYWYFRDNFFDAVLPAAGRLTLEQLPSGSLRRVAFTTAPMMRIPNVARRWQAA